MNGTVVAYVSGPPPEFSLLAAVAECGPLIIAAIVAWIAYRQWSTAQEKLRLDLFDRRLDLWLVLNDAINAEIGRISQIKKPGFEAHDTINIAKIWSSGRAARFLFDTDITGRVERIRRLLLELLTHRSMIQYSHDNPGEAAASLASYSATLESLIETQDEIAAALSRYLTFSDLIRRPSLLTRLFRIARFSVAS